MCGEKQSLKQVKEDKLIVVMFKTYIVLFKVYGNGTGRECRQLVQQLNERRILSQANNNFSVVNKIDFSDESVQDFQFYSNAPQKNNKNKWEKFLDLPDDIKNGFTNESQGSLRKNKQIDESNIETLNKNDYANSNDRSYDGFNSGQDKNKSDMKNTTSKQNLELKDILEEDFYNKLFTSNKQKTENNFFQENIDNLDEVLEF